MQKFRDVLSRWEAGKLSMMEAGELLGMSERQFRRYRDRYEADGLEGLVDGRLGKRSPKRVPERHLKQMLRLYCEVYRGWNVKHFYEHLCQEHGFRWSYTWVKTQLHAAGLVERAKRRGAHRRKRERKPCEGMMLHQDGSRAAWLGEGSALDLIVTMDDATSTIYSASMQNRPIFQASVKPVWIAIKAFATQFRGEGVRDSAVHAKRPGKRTKLPA